MKRPTSPLFKSVYDATYIDHNGSSITPAWQAVPPGETPSKSSLLSGSNGSIVRLPVTERAASVHLSPTERTPLASRASTHTISVLPLYNGRSAGGNISKQPEEISARVRSVTSLAISNVGTVRTAAANPQGFAMEFLERWFKQPAENFARAWLIRLLAILLQISNKILTTCKLHSVDLDINAFEQCGWDVETYSEQRLIFRSTLSQGDRVPLRDTLPSQADQRQADLRSLLLEFLILIQKSVATFLILVQEHTLLMAPVVALGRLSTTALAASTIATMIVSVTGYSVVRGIISALDAFLGSPPSIHPGYNQVSSEDVENLDDSLPSAFTASSFDTLCGVPDSPLSGMTAASPSTHHTQFSDQVDSQQAIETEQRATQMWCFRAALLTSVVLPPIISLWINARPLLIILRQDEEVAKLAAVFLQVAALGLPAFAFNTLMRKYLICIGLENIQSRVLTFITPINMLLNYLLVGGPKETDLGFVGAPMAIAISYNCIALITIFFYLVSSRRVPTVLQSPSDNVSHPLSKPTQASWDRGSSTAAFRDCGRSLMLALIEFFQGIGKLTKAAIAGVAKSASECWSKDATAFVASLIKKLLDRGDTSQARQVAFVSLIVTVVSVIFLSNVILVLGTSISHVFTSDTLVIELAIASLHIIAVYQAFHGASAWVDGTLCAFGKKVRQLLDLHLAAMY
ncbi:hypothetical protein HGRIS_008454 [Hohenbuehelia grisea]|uniref:Uncharacterized protein n=1 Tax=Hohenbuehelia grisea TaxID=104357 RepID=A0ABR3J7Z8_9AGAR